MRNLGVRSEGQVTINERWKGREWQVGREGRKGNTGDRWQVTGDSPAGKDGKSEGS